MRLYRNLRSFLLQAIISVSKVQLESKMYRLKALQDTRHMFNTFHSKLNTIVYKQY